MGLSGTVNPQCTPAADGRTDGQTDGRTDMLLAIAHLMLHALHAWHRWAKNDETKSYNVENKKARTILFWLQLE